MTDTNLIELQHRLGVMKNEIISKDISGWANTTSDAMDALTSLQKENEELTKIVAVGVVLMKPLAETDVFKGEVYENLPATYIERARKALKDI